MRRAPLPVAAALLLAGAAPLAAQISVVPTAGYVLSAGNWLDQTVDYGGGDQETVTIKPLGGFFVGLNAEYAVNSAISLSGHATRTLGSAQKMGFDYATQGPNFGTFSARFEADMATTSIGGLLIFRPLGRLPSGAPRTIYIEAGGSFNIYTVTTGFTDVNDQDAVNEFSFGFQSPAVLGGVGVSFPVGPRASLQIFGRAYYELSDYSSNFVDSVNEDLQGSGTQLQGDKSILLQLGLGLRVGR
jgi:hypothetical protein